MIDGSGSPRRLRSVIVAATLIAAGVLSIPAEGRAQTPGPNVNMVSGTSLPEGDPFLQRQNEPSGAVSSRNPLHLLVGANDYRTVDIAGVSDDVLDPKARGPLAAGDAWLGIFRSIDGGQSWRSVPLPGFPNDPSPEGRISPIKGFAAGADPVVRAGTNGMFYYTGIAFNRSVNGLGALFVSRFIDNNNTTGPNSIPYLDTKVIDSGTAGQFIDKPWMAVDLPRPGAGTCRIQAPGAPGVQTFPAGNAYVAYVTFTGNDNNHHSKLMVARSTDCGASWQKAIKASESLHINQGVTMAIDPRNGTLYVAWREFAGKNAGHAIWIVKSTDGGRSFTKAAQVAAITPFDQGRSSISFRSNAFPTMAVDGNGRVYLAWQERIGGTAGDGKIVLTTSPDGAGWTPRQPVETHRVLVPNPQKPAETAVVPAGRGHQVMPSMTIAGGKVTIVYYDFGNDKAGVWEEYVQDRAGLSSRHTVDVRVVQADVSSGAPEFGASVPVSQYLFGARPGSRQIEQLQYNVPNLPLYAGGTTPFMGDYIDVIGQTFRRDPTTGQWKFNVADGPGVVHAFWTDNRDVRPPQDGLWTNYTPPAIYNPYTGVLLQCKPGQTGARNANIYTSRITRGLMVGAPVNSRRLGSVQRSFVVFAQNNTHQDRRYRFTIATQPEGGRASFLQAFFGHPTPPLLTTVDVRIAARSSASRTVYVTSSDPTASVKVDIVEVPDTGPNPAPVVGLREAVVLNPDITNPDITNPDITNLEVFNPDITNPDITNPDITNPALRNPDITNPDITNILVLNPDITNPDITNPDITNPDITNPDITNPDITNPDITNPDITNDSLSDVTWRVSNSGNVPGSFSIKSFLTKNAPAGFIKQLVLHKGYATPTATPNDCGPAGVRTTNQTVLVANILNPDITNPDITNPDITNPDITNPDITNATLTLSPEEFAYITLRILDPEINDNVTKTFLAPSGEERQISVDPDLDVSTTTSTAAVPQTVDTANAAKGITTPTFEIALVITTTGLADGVTSRTYDQTLRSTGGVPENPSRTWSIVPNSGVLPPGLVLDANTGRVFGTPATAGSYRFTVRVQDSATPPHVATQDLFIRIAPFAEAQSVTTLEDQNRAVTLTALGAENSLLTFQVTTPPANGTLEGVAPNLTYQPALHYFGPDSFAFTATLPTVLGALTSPVATVSMTVTPVNDMPAFSTSGNQTVFEDSGAQTVSGWADNFTPTPPNESDQTVLAYRVTGNTNPVLFSVAPAVSTDGTLTYTPAPHTNGEATITVAVRDTGGTENGGVDTSAPPQIFTITVVAVNDAPSFTKGADQTVLEDATTQTVGGWATAISAGPADEAGQELDFLVTTDNAALFAVPPTISAAGTLSYRPAADANGTAVVTVQLHDDGGVANLGDDTSDIQTFTITVTPVNDIPSFTTSGNQTVSEDSGAQSASGWVSSFSAGPANESGQAVLAYHVTGNTNPVLFSVAPAVANDGTLTYTPAANVNGDATITVEVRDTGGTENGGVDTSAPPQVFTITVVAVNDAPSFTKGADQTVLEDATTQTVGGWATAISAGPADEAGQELDFLVTTDNAALFAVPPAISAAGTLTYTPADHANGSAVVTVQLHDDGGVANLGDDDTSDAQTFTITVTPVNDIPSFTTSGNQTVSEDSGAQSASGWVSSFSAGPANESGQAVLAYHVTGNTNPVLFSVAPAVANDGTLTYTPAANVNGDATITVEVRDTGGTENGGVDTSAPPQVFTITVVAVNDVPSFTKGADQTVLEDATTQTVGGWATAISAGPADETGQTLDFIVTTDNADLFAVQPAITPAGLLSYAPKADANGSALVTVQIHDSGGGTNPGDDDTSDAQTFTIAVTPVNDIPSFTTRANHTESEDSAAQTVPGWVTSFSAGPPNESGQMVQAYHVTGNTNPELFSVVPAVANDGTLTYTPASNVNGEATITVEVQDTGGIQTGGIDTSAPPQVFTITVVAVNDVPSFTKGADQTVLEDAATQTVGGWATAISPGPADEAGQELDFLVTTDNAALFAVPPAISAAGTLTYRPAADANGTAVVTVQLHDDGSVANIGDDNTSDAQTFTIMVTPVNDIPSFTTAANHAVSEDSAGQTLPGWVTGFSLGPVNESTQTVLAYHVIGNTNEALFSVAPVVANDGTLTYTPAANVNGEATITVEVQDTGGTSDGGVDTSMPRTFAITVVAVNDAPSFTKGADPTVLEDAGTQTVAGWATAISAGPADEAGQELDFLVTTDNAALFAVPPAISAAGTLTYTPADHANGSAVVTVQLQDDGGAANLGDDDTSDAQTFSITVTPVNDIPSFTTAANHAVSEDSAGQTLPGWVTGFSLGPVNESTQTVLAYHVIGNTNEALFSAAPAVANDGTLTYTPAPNVNGTATITLAVQDNGGTADGGVDTSASQTFTITVTVVNDAPSFTKGADQTAAEDGGLQTVPGWATSISAGPEDESYQALVFEVSSSDPALFSSLAVSPDGTLTYTPANNAKGSATITVTLQDDGGVDDGGVDESAPATVTITITEVNDPPAAESDTRTTAEETELQFAAAELTGNDSKGPANESGQTLLVTGVNVTPDTHGSVTLSGGIVAYMPAPNYFGPASFSYTVCDNGTTAGAADAKCAEGTVNVTVTDVNDAPSAEDDTATTSEDTPVFVAVLGNDSDPDGDTPAITGVSTPAHGTATTGEGTITYTPAANFHGTDSFTYTISDLRGGTDSATVTVTINAVNDPPIAVDDSFTAFAGTLAAFNVLANDADVDNPPGSVVASIPFLAAGVPNMSFATESAVVTSTGLVYVANSRRIGVLDPATNTVTASMALPVQIAPSLSLVNQTTGIVYFLAGSTLTAVDARPTSATFNTVIATLGLGGTIQSFDLDETRGRLYASYITPSTLPNVPQQAGVAAIDVSPASTTFHQVLYSVPMPEGINARGIAVNETTNRIYVASSSGANSSPLTGGGIYVLDGAASPGTRALTKIPNGVPAAAIAVNAASNLVFAASRPSPNQASIEAIDPANSDAVTIIPVPGLVMSFVVNTHLAVNAQTNRVYVRSLDLDLSHTGNVFVVDGQRGSETFLQVLATIPVGRDNSANDLVVDEGANRIVATSFNDFRTDVIDGENAVTTLISNQAAGDAAVNPLTHTAYISGGTTSLQVIALEDPPSVADTVVVGAAADGPTVETTHHRAFVGRTDGASSVITVNKDGQVGVVTGLPTGAGRYSTLVTNQATDRVYVLNSASNITGTNRALPGFVSVIDAATSAVIANIPVGNFPSGVGINQVTNKVYVSGNSPGGGITGSITVIDGVTNVTTTADISDPAFAGQSFTGGSVANTSTNKVYFRSSGGTSGVTAGVINGATNVATPLSTSFGQITIIRVNNTLNRVYIGNSAGQLFVVNGDDHFVLATLTFGPPHPRLPGYVTVHQLSGRVYVVDYARGELAVLDGTTHAEIARLPVGAGPTSVAVSRDTHRVYVGSDIGNTLTFIDGEALAVLGTLLLPLPVGSIALDPTESRIYTTNGPFENTGVMVIADGNVAVTDSLTVSTVTQGAQGAVAINANGTVTYSPAATASNGDTFTYRITDGEATSNLATVNVAIVDALAITTAASLPAGTAGTPYDRTLTAIGGLPPYVWSLTSGATSLPGGLVLTAGGRIQGTPSASGNFTFTVQVADSAPVPHVVTRTFTLTVGPLIVATSSLPNATRDQPYPQAPVALVAVGGTAPYAWSLAPESLPLPAGLTLNGDGTIGGSFTPALCQTFNFTVQVTDSATPQQTATRNLSLRVVGTVVITTTDATLRMGVALENYSPSLQTTCGSGIRTWSVIDGDLPLGVTLHTNGAFRNPSDLTASAVPRENGSFTFTAQVTDSSGSDTKKLTLDVAGVDQQPGFAPTGVTNSTTFAGATRVAQSFSVGAAGSLVAVRFGTLSCQANSPLIVNITRVIATSGAPDEGEDGVLATMTATITSLNQAIRLPAPLYFAVDTRFAVVLSTTGSGCEISNSAMTDGYVGGRAFLDTGTGWAPLSDTNGVEDIKSDTLIQNTSLVYLTRGLGQVRAVRLNDVDDRVLLIGRERTANIYTPSGAMTPDDIAATGLMVEQLQDATATRQDATATLLECPASNPDCAWKGKVLVTGGSVFVSGTTTYLDSAELFDPATRTWSATGSMTGARREHTATLLADGRVLVAGGGIAVPPATHTTWLQTAEIYDPAAGTFSPAPPMLSPRGEHQATRLTCPMANPTCAWGGKVLLSGGFTTGPSPYVSAELYNPAFNTFVATGAMTEPRADHTATVLADGTVLMAGGQKATGPAITLATTGEIYTPTTNTFASAGALVTPRRRGAAILLEDESVLVSGGVRNAAFVGAPWATAERYVPGSGFVGAPSMLVTRYDHGNFLLADGRVAIVGGFANSGGSRQAGQTVELYQGSSATGEGAGRPSIANPNLDDGSVGVPYTGTTLIGTGGSGPDYMFELITGSLPPGLQFDPETATILNAPPGTGPTAAGSYFFGVRVTDSAGQIGDQTLRIRINSLDITTAYLPNAYFTRPYNATITGTGFAPLTWSQTSGTMPTGLTLNSNGTITGTPTASSPVGFTVRAVDAAGQMAFAHFFISVRNPLAITTTTLRDGVVREGYGGCIGTTGSSQGARTFSISAGALPPGVTFSSGGCFGGSATDTGFFNVTVQVTDESSPPQVETRALTIRVAVVDARTFGGGSIDPVALDGTRRFAQTLMVTTTSAITGVNLWSVQACDPNTVITAQLRPLIGAPAKPDETGLALATATVTTNSVSGGFDQRLAFPSAVNIPQHGRVAVVLTFSGGACEGRYWPEFDWYPVGHALVDDGGWQLANDVMGIGRADIPMDLHVVPQQDLLYLARYRSRPLSARLQDGRLLLVGSDATAEIYDPATSTTTLTGGPSISRWGATATALPDGRVAVIGGNAWIDGVNVALKSIEIFNPYTGAFAPGPDLNVGRWDHTATLLNNGKVLVAGGWAVNAPAVRFAELFDPSVGTVSTPFDMTNGRALHTATLLPSSNKVLLAGGYVNGPPWPAPSAQIYDPDGGPSGGPGTFTATANAMSVMRAEHAAVTLTAGPHAGHVMLVGGTGMYPNLAAQTELFNPLTSTFSTGPSLVTPRMNLTATLVHPATSRVVVTGGRNGWETGSYAISDIEIYDAATNTFGRVGDLHVDRSSHAALLLDSGPNAGQLFIAGGDSTGSLAPRSAELFNHAALFVPATAPLAITSANLPDGTVGVPYTPTALTATGGSGSGYQFSTVWGSLPDGLMLTGGEIAGTPKSGGPSSFVVQVTDSAIPANTATAGFTIFVNRLRITSTSPLLNGAVGHEYSYQFTGTGAGTLTWALDAGSSLPPTFTLSSTGLLTGTPATSGWFGFNVTVRDTAGQVAQKWVNLYVEPPLVITTASTSLPDAVATWNYGWCLSTSGGSWPFTWTKTGGSLPPGLTLDSNTGCLNGRPQRTGIFEFDVSASNAAQQSPEATLTLRVGVVDQAQWSIDFTTPLLTLPIGGGHAVAQTFTSVVAGRLLSVYMPVFCQASPAGVLRLQIQGVSLSDPFLPDNNVLATVDIPTSALPPFTWGAYSRNLALPTPPTLGAGARAAIVLSSTDAACGIVQMQAWSPTNDFRYRYGNGFHASAWEPLDPARPDLPFQTVVDPDAFLAFMRNGRSNHTATLLDSGDVLVAGNFTDTAELFDSDARLFTDTGSMSVARTYFTATKLPDGWVLITGGYDNNGTALKSAQLYNPADGTFRPTSDMNVARFGHAAVLLADGRVLITGGQTGWGPAELSSTEIYEYNSATHTGSFVPAAQTPVMGGSHTFHAITRLADNRVLVTGGWGYQPGRTAEIYTPAANLPGSFAAAGTGLNKPRARHTATLLGNGDVLIAGGWASTLGTVAAVGEIFDVDTMTFTETGNLITPREGHDAALLPNGSVLIAGGQNGDGAVGWFEQFVPGLGKFLAAGRMAVPRGEPTATLLSDGNVLVAGGFGPSAASWSSAELFDSSAPLPTAPVALDQSIATNEDMAQTVTLRATALTGVNQAFTGPFTGDHSFNVAGGVAQSFTPTVSSLGAVDLFITRTGPPVGAHPLTVTIRSDAPGGPVLGTRTVMVPAGMNGTPASPHVLRVAFSPSIGLTAGVKHFIQVDSDGGFYNWAVSASAPYPAGEAYVGGDVLDSDLGFRTYGASTASLTYTITSNPSHGVLSGSAPNLTYTPAANYYGPDSFTFKADDGTLVSNIATVSITVNAVNDAPVAADDSYIADEGVELNVGMPGLLANDTDVDSPTLNAVVVVGPAHGTLTLNGNGSFAYMPASGYSGNDTFTYQANDGFLASTVATVTITVEAATPPTANPDSFAVDENSGSDANLMGFWPFNEGGGATAFDLSGLGHSGTLINSPAWSIDVPPSTANLGSLSFNGLLSQYVSVPNTPALQPTTALTVAAWVHTETSSAGIQGVISKPNSLNSTGWALRLDDNVPTFAFNNGATNCVFRGPMSAEIVPGSWVHIAATFELNDPGPETVTVYRNGIAIVTDATCASGNLDTSAQPLQIGRELADGAPDSHYFSGLIDEPRVYDRVLSDAEVARLVDDFPLVVPAPGLLGNDTDPEGAALSAVLDTPPAHGTVTVNLDGSFTYAPVAGFSGIDTFTYTANNGVVVSDPATVTIVVAAELAEPIHVAVGASPSGVAIDTTTHRAFVANYGSHSLSVLDVDRASATFGQVLGTIGGLSSPRGVAVNPSTHRVYVTQNDAVKVIDGNPSSPGYGTVVATIIINDPSIGIGVDPTTNKIFVGHESGYAFSVIDGVTNAATSLGVGSACGPSGMAVNPVTHRVYIGNTWCGGLRVVDGDPSSPTYLQHVATFGPWTTIRSIAVDPATNRIYVGDESNAWVGIADGATNSAVTSVSTVTITRGVAFSAFTKLVYAAGGGNLYVLDGDVSSPTYGAILATTELSASTFGVEVNSTSGVVVVTRDTDGMVTLLRDTRP